MNILVKIVLVIAATLWIIMYFISIIDGDTNDDYLILGMIFLLAYDLAVVKESIDDRD